MSRKKATARGLIKKAEILLSIVPYMEHGDEEDLKAEHYDVLEYVRIIPPDSLDTADVFTGTIIHEAKKLYRKAFRRLKTELTGGTK